MKQVFSPHISRDVVVGGCKVAHLNVRNALTMRHIVHQVTRAPARTSFSDNEADRGAVLNQMFLNDQIGDCVIAARARRIGLLTTNATGVPFVYTDDQLDAEYGRVGGYVVGDPATDRGCDPTVSADDGVKFGYADGSKDAGWVVVDAANWGEVMLANWITNGACDLSMALPAEWLDAAWALPRKNGDVWDVAGDPDLENGHCVAVVDHDVDKGLLVDTWGLLVWVTPAAVAKYGCRSNNGILIAHVNHDAIAQATGRAPDGFDWTTLLTYFDHDLGGSAPAAAPNPAPGPNVARVGLNQACAWAADGCSKGPVLMTRQGATRRAAAGLAAGWPPA